MTVILTMRFRKKYMKMEIHFAKVMARSEELYKQKLRARKIINRLIREKSRILDTLAGLESEHLKLKDEDDDDDVENGKVSNKQYSIFPEKADIFTDERIWNDDVKCLAQVQSESYEFSSDEENDPVPRNPMSLIEWLRRNQPSVFTIDSGSSGGADGKTGADATPAAGAGGSGTTAAGSKKRKAASTDAGAAGPGSKPGRKRKVAAAAAAAAAAPAAASSTPSTATTQAASPVIVAPAAENGAVVMGDEGAGSTAASDPSNGSLASAKPVKTEE